MLVAINLLNENPRAPSGAQQFWRHLIPEMDGLLREDEELHLLVSRSNRHLYQGYSPRVRHVLFPWSNERRVLRTLTEQLWVPLRLRHLGVTVLNTGIAPLFDGLKLVLHIKTMHAYATPDQLSWSVGTFRRLTYPRSARRAAAIIVNSESLRGEVVDHLSADPAKLKLVYEAVDHELFGLSDNPSAHAEDLRRHGITRPYALFVSSLWPYKNVHGLLRAWALARSRLGGRQLVIVGWPRGKGYLASLHALVRQLGIGEDVVFCGGIDHGETAKFYQSADVFIYPSINESFGLTILEAMACGCPVVTSDTTAMPEIAGGAALLADAARPEEIAERIIEALDPEMRGRLIERGLARAATFSWRRCAAETLEVYRAVSRG